MRNTFVYAIVTLLIAIHFAFCLSPALAEERTSGPAERKVTLALLAGEHDRFDVPVSALIDAGRAQTVLVQFPDGTLGRADQLAEPGLLNASSRGKGKKELHFAVPEMARGETLEVVATLSDLPIEGRSYVWSGEPRQSRRVSCAQCHQGVALPTAQQLREERETLDRTGRVPPFELPKILPTAKGRDFRWHAKLKKYQTSACWECHGRHMVQYEFGQSLDRNLPWAPDPPRDKNAEDPPATRSVYHKVFRMKGDRTFSDDLSSGDISSGSTLPCGVHFGFERATCDVGPCSDVLQQHVGILSEEAGKFMARHCALIKWVSNKGKIAKEERQLTVKNMRARNRSFALWIDFASKLSSVDGTVRLDDPLAGFRFIAPVDGGTTPEHRESDDWRSITFAFEKTTYTAVCFNHPTNPEPHVDQSADRSGLVRGIGYGFSAEFEERIPLFVHYRLWIQEGEMPTDEIRAMSNNFLQPIKLSVR